METKRLLKYGVEECNAYKEIAAYKWKNGFRCRSKKCRHEKYFEGKRPYSRRCLKCKSDESPTAHTVFDKLRMPLHAAIELVKLLASADKKYTINELAEQLLQKTGQDVKPKAIWELALKIFSRMEQENVVYNVYAIAVSFSNITVCWGRSKKKLKYMATVNAPIKQFVLKQTKPDTVIDAFDFMDLEYKTNMKHPTRVKISERRQLNSELKYIRGAVMKFKMLYSGVRNFDRYAQAYLNYYVFLSNKGTYDSLMNDLIRDSKVAHSRRSKLLIP